MPISSTVSAGDQILSGQYNNLRIDANMPDDVVFINLIKNYPSVELAEGALPEYWNESVATLTEQGATTDGSTGSPNERMLKLVATTDTSGYGQQDISISGLTEPVVRLGVTTVSCGGWFYSTDPGTMTLDMRVNGGASLGTDTTTNTGTWT